MGINRNPVAFDLRSEVAPVALVDSSVDFLASPSPAYRVVDTFTQGLLTNPGAGTLLASTGPLPTGPYTVVVQNFAESGGPFIFIFQWRDAANVADLLTFQYQVEVAPRSEQSLRLQIENANERFQVLNLAAPGAGIDLQTVIFARI